MLATAGLVLTQTQCHSRARHHDRRHMCPWQPEAAREHQRPGRDHTHQYYRWKREGKGIIIFPCKHSDEAVEVPDISTGEFTGQIYGEGNSAAHNENPKSCTHDHTTEIEATDGKDTQTEDKTNDRKIMGGEMEWGVTHDRTCA